MDQERNLLMHGHMLKKWDNYGIPLCKRSHQLQKDYLHIMLCEIYTFHHFHANGIAMFSPFVHLCMDESYR
jgi:hypothetical protein